MNACMNAYTYHTIKYAGLTSHDVLASCIKGESLDSPLGQANSLDYKSPEMQLPAPD